MNVNWRLCRDIGGGTMDIAVYTGCCRVIPKYPRVNVVTAISLMPLVRRRADAEAIKVRHGCARFRVPSSAGKDVRAPASSGGVPPRSFRNVDAGGKIESLHRAALIFWSTKRYCNYGKTASPTRVKHHPAAGIVLTGGAHQRLISPRSARFIRRCTRREYRSGRIMPSTYYSTAVGLLHYGKESHS